MTIKSDLDKTVESKYIPFSYGVMKSFKNKPFWQGVNTFNIVFNSGIALFLTPSIFTILAISFGMLAFLINVALEYKD
jgi:hypothetical protein